MSEAQEIKKSIEKFSGAMFSKMKENIGKKEGWYDIEILYALDRIKQEIGELENALISQDKIAAQSECADIANFCMMLYKSLEGK